jgi:hypothetical protein
MVKMSFNAWICFCRNLELVLAKSFTVAKKIESYFSEGREARAQEPS